MFVRGGSRSVGGCITVSLLSKISYQRESELACPTYLPVYFGCVLMEIGNRTGKSRFHEFLQELSIWLFFILKFISCYLSANTTSKQCGEAYSEIWGVLSQVSRNCWCCLDWHWWFTKMTRLSYFNTWSMSQTLSCNFRVQSPFFTDISHSPNEKGLQWLNVLWDMIYIFSSGT